MGNYTEFRRVYKLVAGKTNFDADINVSVFETNIRIVGGLLSAHLLAKKAGAPLEPGWPCSGPLLRLAEDAAKRLLPAFNTPTGMPYGTINLRSGVPPGETPVTCTAGVATVIVEFGTLSRLTGNEVYEEAAMRALRALWHHRSAIGLVGNHIDVLTGKWTATDAGIGAGVDSYYEYLVKGAALLQRPELMQMFLASRESLEQYMNHDDWYFWVSMKSGGVTMPVFQSLEAFWPGLLSLAGDNMSAMKSIHNYHQIWKQYGFLPEFYNVAQGGASHKREGYPLRPELIESAMYLYKATKDPWLLSLGEDMLTSIEYSARTDCGYATVKDVRDHTLEDRMESFFLSETTKYLYLLFDVNNTVIHNEGNRGTVHKTPHGECVLDTGGYIFNTEAHPIDAAALQCCSGHTDEDIKKHVLNHMLDIFHPEKFNEFQGDLIPTRIKQIKEQRAQELERKKQRQAEYEFQMEEQRRKEREYIRRKKEMELKKYSQQLKNQEQLQQNDSTAIEESDNAGDQEDKVVIVNSSTVMSMEYDNVELNPAAMDSGDFVESDMEANPDPEGVPDMSDVIDDETKVIENSSPQKEVLIKRQSKDETVEEIKIKTASTSGMKKKAKLDLGSSLFSALNDIVIQYLPTTSGSSDEDEDHLLSETYDPDVFREKLLNDNKQYPLNLSWSSDFSVMSCRAQTFTERFSIQGEFFDSYP